MKKNVASQKIGVQMCSATDGSAFTGTVTVYVTGDAGTQTIGSVGSGVCTHEGNGYHTYAPSQAETNYDLIAFTFIGTGAIPSTVQVATVPSDGVASPTNITAGVITTVSAVTGLTASDVGAIKAKTDNLPSDPADQSLVLAAIAALNNLSAAQVNAEVLDVLNVDTFAELSAPPAATSSLRAKLTWVFMWLRNKSTQTETQRKLYADDATTVVGTETIADDGTTYTKGEVA